MVRGLHVPGGSHTAPGRPHGVCALLCSHSGTTPEELGDEWRRGSAPLPCGSLAPSVPDPLQWGQVHVPPVHKAVQGHPSLRQEVRCAPSCWGFPTKPLGSTSHRPALPWAAQHPALLPAACPPCPQPHCLLSPATSPSAHWLGRNSSHCPEAPRPTPTPKAPTSHLEFLPRLGEGKPPSGLSVGPATCGSLLPTLPSR